MSKDSQWIKGIKEIWHPEYDFIIEEIDRLFEEEKLKVLDPKKPRKNLELVRIYLPKKYFELLEKLPEFRELHNLGGIACTKSRKENIGIEVETINPRKRKKRTIVYVRKEDQK